MKKFLVIAILMAMGVSIMAGCSQTAQNQQTSQNQQTVASSSSRSTAETASEKPARVSWYWNEGGVQLPEDSYICKKVLEDLNIQYVPINPKGSDYEQQLQLLLASGNSPDVITSYKSLTGNLKKWGVIQPIEKYLTTEYIPNVIRIENNWDIALKNETAKDGHVWAMPNTNQSTIATVPYIRNDWLNNLGLQKPTTLDELAVVLEKFTNGDPDKNGKNDTVGVMVNAYYGIGDIAFETAASPNALYLDENGNAVHGMFLPRHKDFLKYVRNLIQTGAMDPESATTKAAQVKAKVKSGKAGFMWGYSNYTWNDDIRKVEPNAEWIPIQPPKGAYDKGYLNGAELEREQYCVSSQCKNADAVFKLMNYMADDKSTADHYDFSGTYWDMKFGERGVHWIVDDNGILVAGKTASDQKIAEQNNIDNWTGVCGRIQNKFDFTFKQSLSPAYQKLDKEVQGYPTSYDIPDSNPLKPIDTTAWMPDEAFSAFEQEWFNNKWPVLYYKAILGKVDIDKGWDDFMAEAKKAGLDQIIADTTKSLKDNGVLK